MAENSVSLPCRTKYYNLNTNRDYLKEFRSSPSEEVGTRQCNHQLNLIKYLVPMTMSILWITSFGKLMERPRPKGKKL